MQDLADRRGSVCWTERVSVPVPSFFFLSPALFEDQGSGRVALLIFYHTRFQQRWSFHLSPTGNSAADRVMLPNARFPETAPCPVPCRISHRESNVCAKHLPVLARYHAPHDSCKNRQYASASLLGCFCRVVGFLLQFSIALMSCPLFNC
jgi:hypothetical protein